MRKNSFLFFLLVLFFVAATLPAQDARVFTMDDVIYLARTQSPDSYIAKHRFRSNFWQYRSYKATKLPQMNFSATLPSYNRSIDGVEQNDGTVNYLERQYLDTYGSINIRQQLGFSGGEVFLSSGLRRYDNMFDGSSVTSFTSIPIVNVGLSQPLFQYNSLKWAKKLEPMRYEEARRSYLETLESISEKAVIEFFSLLSAQIDLQIAEKNMAAYDTLFRLSQGRFQMGKIPEPDLLQIELQLLQATANVENYRISYDNQLIQFKSFLRLQDGRGVVIVPPQVDKYLMLNVEDVLVKAIDNSSTALGFQRRLIEAESELNRSKMDGRFDANIYAAFGLTATGEEFYDAYKHPLDQQQVQVGLSVPIWDWGVARGKIKMAESNLELTQTQIQQDELDLVQEIYVKVARFNMQQQQITIAAKSDTVARKSYQLTQQRYMAGKDVTFLDINNAQVQSDNALKSYYNVLMNYWRSYYEIRRLTLFDWERKEELSFDEKELL